MRGSTGRPSAAGLDCHICSFLVEYFVALRWAEVVVGALIEHRLVSLVRLVSADRRCRRKCLAIRRCGCGCAGAVRLPHLREVEVVAAAAASALDELGRTRHKRAECCTRDLRQVECDEHGGEVSAGAHGDDRLHHRSRDVELVVVPPVLVLRDLTSCA